MDPFATLGLERKYQQDLRAAEKTHRELSRALHPDKYVGHGASERRDALSRAVEVNEAWRVVRDPIKRAEALFTLVGIAIGDTNEPKPDAALLMDMMEQREALGEARAKRDVQALKALLTGVAKRAAGVEQELGSAFDVGSMDREKLVPMVKKLGELRYCRRLSEEVSNAMDDLEAHS